MFYTFRNLIYRIKNFLANQLTYIFISIIKSLTLKIKIPKLVSLKLLKEEVDMILCNLKSDFGGGCSLEKALLMAILIKGENMKTTCDIGVYRGRSFFPQAVAHQIYSKGIVYGVDPYSNEEAIQHDNLELKEKLDDFLSKIDLNLIFKEVNDFRINNSFEKNSFIIRKRSDDAALFFKKSNIVFDMVHIDGNHDRDIVLSDVNLYYPILKKKGFIILDDILWDSITPANAKLNHLMKKIFEFQSNSDGFAIFWKGKGILKLLMLKLKTFLYFYYSKITIK